MSAIRGSRCRGRSEGLVSSALHSDDGGFGFTATPTGFVHASADAYRADLSVGLGDFFQGSKGRLTLYSQTLGAGYSAPGQATLTDTEHSAARSACRSSSASTCAAKGDKKEQDQGSRRHAGAERRLPAHRRLERQHRRAQRRARGHSPVVPLTREQGERTDGVVQVGYDSGASWRAYGFVRQNTLSKSEDRGDNGRSGPAARIA